MEHSESPPATDYVVPYGPGELVHVPQHSDRPDVFTKDNRVTPQGWVYVAKRVIADFSVDAMLDRAAALTYYAVLSIAPMILAVYSIATLLLPRDEAAVNDIIDDFIALYVPEALEDEALRFLLTVIGTPAQSTIALVVSIVVSLLSASAYVRSFSRNANVMYGRIEGRNLVRTWFTMWVTTLIMVLGVIVIIVGTFLRESIVNGLLQPIAEPLGMTDTVDYLTKIFLPVWDYARFPVIIVTAIALISVLYYVSPNVRPEKFRLLTLGSSMALTAIFIIWLGFSWFIGTIGISSAYGAFGTAGAVLVLVWVMNVVLLEGVKIDAEVLRVKQLQVGYDAKTIIQVPPRSTKAVDFRLKVQRWIDRSASTLKAQEEDDDDVEEGPEA
ncbi:YihY/virulence factor BrkB family protein [Corynebacterium pseudogenitalium]|uniref:YihY/virulence factor BrkB family protein n=1 Tax=Corynebacterium pseudogenitalium TaxID=38303 RepID=UPI002109332F|nr:YihY/virulence factor BrkB family protein [Corynebacterium pseudogenitalium]MCQ4607212.1 YihY/virulence factor BrkB family protein [Corynebacterium pseudogenitalium]